MSWGEGGFWRREKIPLDPPLQKGEKNHLMRGGEGLLKVPLS
jgi:hypothetical protein